MASNEEKKVTLCIFARLHWIGQLFKERCMEDARKGTTFFLKSHINTFSTLVTERRVLEKAQVKQKKKKQIGTPL